MSLLWRRGLLLSRTRSLQILRTRTFVAATIQPDAKKTDAKRFNAQRSIAHLPLFGWKVLAATGAITAAKKVAIVGIVNKYGVRETFALLRSANSKVRDLGLTNESQHGMVDEGMQRLEVTVRGLQKNEAAQKIYEYFENLEKRNPNVAASVLKVFIENFKSFKVFRTVMNPKHSIVGTEGADTAVHSEIESQKEYEELLNKMQKVFPELKNYHVVLVRKEHDAAE